MNIFRPEKFCSKSDNEKFSHHRQYESILRILDRSTISSSDMKPYFESRLQKLEVATFANLCELLVCILNERIDGDIADNIYNISFTCNLIEISKSKKSSHVSSFKLNPLMKSQLPKKFNKRSKNVITTIKQFFNQHIADKTTIKLIMRIVMSGEMKLRKEMASLCMVIVIYSMQNVTKSFEAIRKKFTKICKTSILIRRLNFDARYLREMKSVMNAREMRQVIGCEIVETLHNYGRHASKAPLECQYYFARLVKSLFYMSDEILIFTDKMLSYLKENQFANAIEILIDDHTFHEIINWLPELWRRCDSSILFKKRMAMCYRNLWRTQHQPLEYRHSSEALSLERNAATVSFFIGLVDKQWYEKKGPIRIRKSLIVEKYFMLGVLLKNRAYLDTIRPQIELCVERRESIPSTVLDQHLCFLESANAFPAKYKLDSSVCDTLISSKDDRKVRDYLISTMNQILFLKEIRSEIDPIRRNNMILELSNTLRDDQMIRTEMLEDSQLQPNMMISDSDPLMYIEHTQSESNKSDFSYSHISSDDSGNISSILSDLSNNSNVMIKDRLSPNRSTLCCMFKNSTSNHHNYHHNDHHNDYHNDHHNYHLNDHQYAENYLPS